MGEFKAGPTLAKTLFYGHYLKVQEAIAISDSLG